MLAASSQVSVGRPFGSFIESKNNRVVVLVALGKFAPEVAEGAYRQATRANYRARIGRIIVNIKNYAQSPRCGTPDNGVDPDHLGIFELAQQSMLEALPKHRKSNDVHPFASKVVECGWSRIYVIPAVLARIDSAPNAASGRFTPLYCIEPSVASALSAEQTARASASRAMQITVPPMTSDRGGPC